MKPTLPLLPLMLAVIFLSGCPDPKMPKVPPKVPEPKAVGTQPGGVKVLTTAVFRPVRRTA